MVNNGASHRASILRSLRAQPEAVGGASLSEELALSRVAVWKHVEALRAAGYAIEADRQGYRLRSEADSLSAWEFPGREDRVVKLEETDSTMNRALELGMKDPGSRAIVIAERQSSGRGRRGKAWASPPGGLFATILLDPALGSRSSGGLVGIALLELVDCLRGLTGEPVEAAWPNDLVLGGKKLGGILMERLESEGETRALALGIGLNVANASPGPAYFSLSELGPSRPGRSRILGAFLDRLECPAAFRLDPSLLWDHLSKDRGKPVRSAETGRLLGRAAGIDAQGRLHVEDATGGLRSYTGRQARIDNKESP